MILPPTKLNCILSLSDTAEPLLIKNIITPGLVKNKLRQLIDNHVLFFLLNCHILSNILNTIKINNNEEIFYNEHMIVLIPTRHMVLIQ
jgi:hypothetical protein